jgi:hypothetical protein
MKKILVSLKIILILFFIKSSFASTFNWPVDNPNFTSHFGESRGDHWHSGIDVISGTRYELKAPAEGEVIYYYDEASFPMSDNFGMGNYIVLQHKNNLATLHYHLEAGSIIKNKTKIKSDDIIATMGNSGRSSGRHLHMSVYNTDDGRIFNPIDYFPQVEDKKKAVITKILLKGPMSSAVNVLKSRRIRRKSFYRIIIAFNDVREGPSYLKAPVAARKVELYIDDKLVRTISFDYLKVVNNTYCLNENPDMAFERVYFGREYHVDMVGFKQTLDKHEFRVLVTDNGGNTTEKKVRVSFY